MLNCNLTIWLFDCTNRPYLLRAEYNDQMSRLFTRVINFGSFFETIRFERV